MHREAYTWIRALVGRCPPRLRVVEIGGRDINGSVRGLFPGAEYTAIDVAAGPGVDVVADGATYRPESPPDTVVCCEVLEHAPNAEAVVQNAVRMLAPGGMVILTCATDPRAPHSGHDGAAVRPGEHYANVAPVELERWLRAAGAERMRIETDLVHGDLRAEAWAPGASSGQLSLLLVHPGADWSTADVFDGYQSAFRALGHTVGAYNLHVRLGRAAEWLEWNWRKAGRPDPRPGYADTLYLAGCDVVTAALQGDVDWVVVFTGSYLHPDLFRMLRRAGRRIALVLTESPYEDDQQVGLLPLVDVAFTNERTSVGPLRRANPNVYYLPHAYDPSKHRPDDDGSGMAVPAHDVVFVGTGFPERLEALAAVDWSGIDLGLYGTYDLLGSRSKLRRHIRGGVIENAMASALYRNARIGLNLYRRSTEYRRGSPRTDTAESMNPRAFELAACGAFSISDHRAEQAEVFGELVPTFDDPSELGALVRRWLDDDAGRAAIRAALPERIARSAFTHRAAQVAAFLAAIGREMTANHGRGADGSLRGA